MKIDYIKQLEKFYSILNYNPISANAVSIYLFILEIANELDWIEKFSIANTTLVSKFKGMTLKQFQIARNEIINRNLVKYYKGRNQNEAPKYSVISLCEEEMCQEGQTDGTAEGMAEVTAEGMAEGHIITKLNLFFIFILYNDQKFEDINQDQKIGIIKILEKLDIYINTSSLKIIPYSHVNDFKIQYWAVKELYQSSYKVYLKNITRDVFINKYLKTKKYAGKSVKDTVNYFIKSLQNEFEREAS